ncbi:MAG: hypothetical protein H7707_03505 [Acetobacter sp.]|nr:hypothetical protein [Acetobacter sp.]
MTNTHNDDDDTVITKEDAELSTFDPAEYIVSKEDRQLYLNISLKEDEDLNELGISFDTLIRAWALSKIVRKTKIKRKKLCGFLLGDSELKSEDLTKIAEALGLKMPADFHERFGLKPEKTVKTSIPYTPHKQAEQPHVSL